MGSVGFTRLSSIWSDFTIALREPAKLAVAEPTIIVIAVVHWRFGLPQ